MNIHHLTLATLYDSMYVHNNHHTSISTGTICNNVISTATFLNEESLYLQWQMPSAASFRFCSQLQAAEKVFYLPFVSLQTAEKMQCNTQCMFPKLRQQNPHHTQNQQVRGSDEVHIPD